MTGGPAAGKTHVVAPGENLFRIALSHGLKYQQLASWNNIQDNNIIIGQVLRLTPPNDNNAVAATVSSPANADRSSSRLKAYPQALKLSYSAAAANAIAAESEGKNLPPAAESSPAKASGANASEPVSSSPDSVSWMWPTKGQLLNRYSESNKGIDIGGRSGQPIVAAAQGKVVYSGTVRGYGKLIIIKHNKTFLSAYAHNSQLLVKEGDAVKKGQKIAEMGNTDADQVKLHFEVRRVGKAVDPMQYLNSSP